jgi:hypothetical protein
MNRTLLALAFSSVPLLATAGLAHEDHEHPKKKATPAAPAPPAPPAAPAAAATPAAHAHAPGDHAHESPHGGIVGTVDKDTHVEVLFSDTDVQAWFYDADMKPLPPPADARATVVVGKDVKKLDLPVAKAADGTATDHLGAPFHSMKGKKLSILIQATVAG